MPPLYPFARVDGGYREGQKNQDFRIYMATGPGSFDNGSYKATGCGGHFWKISKGAEGEGPGLGSPIHTAR